MSYQRINYEERVKIWYWFQQTQSVTKTAKQLKRSKSTISRELSFMRSVPFGYLPEVAQQQASKRAKGRNRPRKLTNNPKLFAEVLRLLKKKWSPVQISVMLKKKYPKDSSMQISHESIYSYIYVLPRGELKKELISRLRQKRATQCPQHSRKTQGKIHDMISIEERPKEVEGRSLAGDWEGDLIIGKDHASQIGTLVERKTRLVLLVPLKSKKAEEVRRAFEKKLKKLPPQLLNSLTYDQGKEMSEHKLFEKNTKMKVFFCHPASPWERGTCENTNGLIRDYFPKKTDFNKISSRELLRVQHELNERPRKTLDFRTPKEVFAEEVLKIVSIEP